MSQKLKALEKILTSLDNDIELSFNKCSSILVKDLLTLYNPNLLRDKYLNIHKILKGVNIFTSFDNKIINHLFKINLYKEEKNKLKKIIKEYLWAPNKKEVCLFTIFDIKDGKKFTDSLLIYIDEIKNIETETLSKKIQNEKLDNILKNNQIKFGKNDFSFDLSIEKYFKDNIEYYKRLNENKNIEIKNIVIFNGVIKFYIQNINNKLELQNTKSITFLYIEKSGFGILSNGNGDEYKFKKGKNTYYVVKESIERGNGEIIDFIELINILHGKESQDKYKMVYNAVNYANTKIAETFKIGDFFLVEEKAYKRQYKVNNR